MTRRKQKIEFLMPTDWMFEKPIDKEHKEYKLLSYFQKMGEKLDKLELYPGFIELSLHLMNVQTLIREKKIIYTDKKFYILIMRRIGFKNCFRVYNWDTTKCILNSKPITVNDTYYFVAQLFGSFYLHAHGQTGA